MQLGVQFFPAVRPRDKDAASYFADCLEVVEEADRLGFTHARTVEHYFEAYGGYSPNPIVFLSAMSQRAKRMRLVTGAVLPVFNNPLKLAGEIGMLDAISGGRLDVGFARAFLPHEFRRFGVSIRSRTSHRCRARPRSRAPISTSRRRRPWSRSNSQPVAATA
jgi:alkanesulfonate monooxygenase SsuD/methylene tetrahydromethanopterin reductase-like flavin-dependent oxidoreductase (luciferase family)